MDDNKLEGEVFNSLPEDENTDMTETEAVQEETQADVFYEEPTEFSEPENIAEITDNDYSEASFESAEESTQTEAVQPEQDFFQDYPRPEIPQPVVAPAYDDSYNAADKAAEEPIQQAEEKESVVGHFNPYAPAAPVQQEQAQQVSPAYTQLGGQNQFSQPYNQYAQPAPQPEEPKKSKGKTLVGIIVVACLALAIIGMVAALFNDKGQDGTTTTGSTNATSENASGGFVTVPTQPTTQTLPENSTQATTVPTTAVPTTQLPNSIYVADKVRPSVVGVMTYVEGKVSEEGSGVLMSEKDGWTYVVTCAHVISADNVTYGILLLDGRRYEAQLVAYDNRTDIGVVKVEATGLPIAEFGDSTTLRIGEPVYAIGNPGGSEYFGSITNGIVSAIDRSVTSTYTMTCIQHNAAINPGNSGGALVNSAGQVIGINSSKIASTEYEGMGFAVPTSIASPIVDALVEHGYVPNRPKLGIEYAPISSYQLYSLVASIKGLPQGSLVIAGISEDSSLAGTEAQVGDLIIAVNGKNMDNSSVLLDLIETGSVGDSLTLTLCRIENRTYKTSTFDVVIRLVEDKPVETQATVPSTEYQDDGYYRGGAGSFEDFFNDYFGW